MSQPRQILILDTETSGLDKDKDHLLEVGMVRWSVEHRTTLSSSSFLLRAPENPAEKINRIPPAALADGMDPEQARGIVTRWAAPVDAIVAHSDFDRQWLPGLGKPWIDSAWDIDYPMAELATGRYPMAELATGRRVVDLLLAHGLAVIDPHRALPDCQMLARLFERVWELGFDVGVLLEKAMRPKVKVVAVSPGFDAAKNLLFKQAGFRWNPDGKEWWRMLPEEDLVALPFKTRIVRGLDAAASRNGSQPTP